MLRMRAGGVAHVRRHSANSPHWLQRYLVQSTSSDQIGTHRFLTIPGMVAGPLSAHNRPFAGSRHGELRAGTAPTKATILTVRPFHLELAGC